jgi:hypothetical protein
MFKTQMAAVLTVVLAIAASACSATEARPVAAAAGVLACPGGTVRTNDDAARFEGCRTIEGDLRISQSDLIDVAAFRELRSVTGKLVVQGNAKLVSLAGLNHVEYAQGVEIRNNRVLAAFPALLPQLKHVDQNVVLDANRGLSKRQVSALVDRIEQRNQQVTANDAVATLN